MILVIRINTLINPPGLGGVPMLYQMVWRSREYNYKRVQKSVCYWR